MAKQKKHDSSHDIPPWVVTFGDMMSLLLCFFILLAAFSELKKEREFVKVLEKIREAFGETGGISHAPTEIDWTNSTLVPRIQLNKNKEDKQTESSTPEVNMEGKQDRSDTIRPGNKFAIGGSLVFDPGSADLTAQLKARLRHVAPQIRGKRNIFEIRGHAAGLEDRVPDLSYTDLSYMRAVAVMNFLVEECGVDGLILRPIAAGNYEPLTIDMENPGAQSVNSRVQIEETEVLIDQLHPDPGFTGRNNGWPG